MNATRTLPPGVAAYLDEVRTALDDLPVEERDELLADVEVSLLEEAAGGEPPAARLGPPQRFAAELRAAAGLEPPKPPAGTGPLPLSRLAQRAGSALHHPRARAAAATARELGPIWWVVRAYVALAIVAMPIGDGWSDRDPLIPQITDSLLANAAILLVAVAVSLALGLRHRRQAVGRWPAVANVALAVLAMPVAAQLLDAQRVAVEEPIVVEATTPGGLVYDGETVRNVYPYSRDGRLLLDVLLYDQNGRPLNVGNPDMTQDPLRRYLRTRSGRILRHSFPIRYFEPGEPEVRRPKAAPDVDVPRIATPPLRP